MYQQFLQLPFRELDERQLASLRNGSSRAWIVSLATVSGVSAEAKRFERSLGRVLRRDSRQLELIADFASLFLLVPPASASPYAGRYPYTTAAEECRRMNALLTEQGLVVQENEPSGHITVQLTLMTRVVAREERLSAQYYFLHHHILCRTPLFRDACLVRDNEGFYPQVVNLIVRFI